MYKMMTFHDSNIYFANVWDSQADSSKRDNSIVQMRFICLCIWQTYKKWMLLFKRTQTDGDIVPNNLEESHISSLPKVNLRLDGM